MFSVESFIDNYRKRYIFALLIIGILVSSAYLLLNQQYKYQQDYAQMINFAGEQRMLSQKISLLALKITNLKQQKASVDNQLQRRLLLAANKMKSNQKYLVKQLPSLERESAEKIEDYYFGERNLNERVGFFVESALSLLNTPAGQPLKVSLFQRDVPELLLIDLNKVVSLFEDGANSRLIAVERMALSTWLTTLFSLLLVAVVIFKPISKLLTKVYNQLLKEKARVEDFQFAINKHSIVIKTDKNRNLLFYNKKFRELYGYKKEEIIGQNFDVLKREFHDDDLYGDIIKTLARKDVWRGETCNRAKNGHLYWFTTTFVPLKVADELDENYIIIQNDITEQKKTEEALRKLHEITSDSNSALTDKINLLLTFGCELFQLPLGLVSRIQGDNYTVQYACTPNDEVVPGEKFELGNTYCLHTLAADAPVAFNHVGESEIANHPCYERFGLESYLGTPLIVEGERFGTLNFSSPDIYPRHFTDSDLELIQLISQWISHEFMLKGQQELLEGQKQLMEQMSQLAKIGAWEVDLISSKITWSSMTKKIHEVADDFEPVMSTAINFYKEGENRDRIKHLVEKSISAGESYHEELQIVTAKGNEIWVAAKGESEFKNGQCVRMFGSFQDISASKAAETEIQDKNTRMALAADSAGIGIWDLNVVTNELSWDKWMFKLYGVKEVDFSGAYEAWANGLHPDDKEASTRLLQLAINTDSKFDTQFRIIWPNGNIRYLKASAIKKLDEHGKVTNMIGVNYDVTDRVENEIALTSAKIEAESAAKAKNEFLASMSHEIRTPMNGVIGMLELLDDTDLTKEQHHRVSIAQNSAHSLLNLINDILDFSKIDADKLDLENISFDLQDMMGKLVESLAIQAQSKGLELILDTASLTDNPKVIGDPSRIRQILTNLISNSIKFTHEGEVLVTAILVPSIDNNWRLKLTVSDTGIGIEKSKQTLLFESFSQVDSSTTRNYGGTGLGLTIVKKLCQRMDGDVSVISKAGEGSHFICDIAVGKTMQSPSSLANNELSLLKVLVVDDSMTNGEVIVKQFNQWRVQAIFASSGQSALSICNQLIEEKKPLFDIALVDMNMPMMNEEELSLALRELPELRKMKIVLMTPMQTQKSDKWYSELGIAGYFPKPATAFGLLASLQIKNNDSFPIHISAQTPQKVDNDLISDDTESEPSHQAITTKPLNLLLVEDNRVNQMVAKGVLKKIGIECDIAQNGLDALQKLSQSQTTYDLALMDIQMPEMDGYQATRGVRQGEGGDNHKDMIIIAMTANAMAGDHERCLEAGMNDYLSKPINIDALKSSISRFFKE